MQHFTRVSLIVCLASTLHGPALAQGKCGSSFKQRLSIPDYACFGSAGEVKPFAPCATTALIGYRTVHFGTACKLHDSCYGRKGAKKLRCDNDFGDLLKATCEETLDGRFRSQALPACRRMAIAAFTAVRAAGCEAFTKAQATAGIPRPTCD